MRPKGLIRLAVLEAVRDRGLLILLAIFFALSVQGHHIIDVDEAGRLNWVPWGH